MTKGEAWVRAGSAFISISPMPSSASGEGVVEERYSNLFEMYENITGENAYERPMRIYPAVHYTMGGSWVDYNLMSNVPGLHVMGEANFSDHGANRLGASALMQGLADGYFVIPYTIGNYLTGEFNKKRPQPSDPAFQQTEKEVRERVQRLLEHQGHPDCRQLPSRARPPHVGQMRDGPR